MIAPITLANANHSNSSKSAYRSKHQLTSHMNVHSDDRPFKCDVCSKTFRSRTAFKMHQDQHKGIKRFTCKFCDRRFQCHANKLKHERRHIGIKRHKCELCDKGKWVSKRKFDSVSHVLNYSPFKLSTSAFIEKQELRNHLKVHEKQSLVTDNARDKTGSGELKQQPGGGGETKL